MERAGPKAIDEVREQDGRIEVLYLGAVKDLAESRGIGRTVLETDITPDRVRAAVTLWRRENWKNEYPGA